MITFSVRILSVVFLLLAGSSLAEAKRKSPHVVFVTGDHEYSSEETMPALARELEKNYPFHTTVLRAYPNENAEENIPGLEALERADLAIFFLRWRRLPEEQLKQIEKYLESGRPVVAFRTTTHAFNYPKDHPLVKWNAFATDFLGGPPGWGNGHFHYGHRSSTDVYMRRETKNHQILKGVDAAFHVRSWLYHVLPKYPPADATVLLMGRAVNPDKKDSIDNPVAWTWKNKAGGRVFMTTLGHPEDFRVAAFQRLVLNAVHWALGKGVPDKWAGQMKIDATYHGIRK